MNAGTQSLFVERGSQLLQGYPPSEDQASTYSGTREMEYFPSPRDPLVVTSFTVYHRRFVADI